MTTAPTSARPHAFAFLLDRYVCESVGEAAFSAVCDMTEDAGLTASERLAFARFYLDALAGGDDVPMPRADEIADVLLIARA